MDTRILNNYSTMPSILSDGSLNIVRKTAIEFTSLNPVLNKDEFGLETDTGNFKIGDGTTAWTSLSYAASAFGSAVAEIATPSSPAASTGIVFFRDDGAGKTQLCVLFSSGAVQVIAQEL